MDGELEEEEEDNSKDEYKRRPVPDLASFFSRLYTVQDFSLLFSLAVQRLSRRGAGALFFLCSTMSHTFAAS